MKFVHGSEPNDSGACTEFLLGGEGQIFLSKVGLGRALDISTEMNGMKSNEARGPFFGGSTDPREHVRMIQVN